MKIAKKPKKKKHPIDKLPTEDIIRITNYLNISVNILTMWALEKWNTEEQFRDYLESYKALLEEVNEKRITVGDVMLDASCKTGVDITKLVDEVFGSLGTPRKK